MDEVLEIALVGGLKGVGSAREIPPGDKGVGEGPVAH